jgi:hypothetical protein
MCWRIGGPNLLVHSSNPVSLEVYANQRTSADRARTRSALSQFAAASRDSRPRSGRAVTAADTWACIAESRIGTRAAAPGDRRFPLSAFTSQASVSELPSGVKPRWIATSLTSSLTLFGSSWKSTASGIIGALPLTSAVTVCSRAWAIASCISMRRSSCSSRWLPLSAFAKPSRPRGSSSRIVPAVSPRRNSQRSYFLRPCSERIASWLVQLTELEIHVEFGLMQGFVLPELYSENVGNGCLLEPGEIAERQEILARCRLNEQPETVCRDVLHLNGRSGPSRLCGFHRRTQRVESSVSLRSLCRSLLAVPLRLTRTVCTPPQPPKFQPHKPRTPQSR